LDIASGDKSGNLKIAFELNMLYEVFILVVGNFTLFHLSLHILYCDASVQSYASWWCPFKWNVTDCRGNSDTVEEVVRRIRALIFCVLYGIDNYERQNVSDSY